MDVVITPQMNREPNWRRREGARRQTESGDIERQKRGETREAPERVRRKRSESHSSHQTSRRTPAPQFPKSLFIRLQEPPPFTVQEVTAESFGMHAPPDLINAECHAVRVQYCSTVVVRGNRPQQSVSCSKIFFFFFDPRYGRRCRACMSEPVLKRNPTVPTLSRPLHVITVTRAMSVVPALSTASCHIHFIVPCNECLVHLSSSLGL